jgi:hypothetical protein
MVAPRRTSTPDAVSPTAAENVEDAGVVARLFTVLIDVFILAVIDVVVVYLTMQICGLSLDDLRILPRGLASAGRQVDPDRSADVEPNDRARRLRRPEHGELIGRQIAVDIDQGHRRRCRHPQLPSCELDQAALRLIDKIVPTKLLKLVLGTRGDLTAAGSFG